MRSNYDLICHVLIFPVSYHFFHGGDGQLFMMWCWFGASLAFGVLFLRQAGFPKIRKFALLVNLSVMLILSVLATYSTFT